MIELDPLVAKLGVSRSLASGEWDWPVHGLRHQPEADTSGWYWWTGEWSDEIDFFVPLHASHLADLCPAIIDHLRRPPGSRVLIAPDYLDIWADEALLDV